MNVQKEILLPRRTILALIFHPKCGVWVQGLKVSVVFPSGFVCSPSSCLECVGRRGAAS